MLIDMRNALMAGGGLSAKSYVQDGLVAMWDGIENAGWGVHDPNATVWKDLIGDIDLTFYSQNASVEDNRVECSGTGCVARSAAGKNLTAAAQQIESVLRIDRVSAQIILNAKGQVYYTDTAGYIGYRRSNGAKHGSLVTSFSHWLNQGVYVNGRAESMTRLNDDWSAGTYNYLFLGRVDSLSDRYTLKGAIYNLRLYSRALDADDIAANYAVDKARFNLPDAT